MPNSIGPLGLTTATQAELLANSTVLYEQVYGPDINIASDTPDGQVINLQIQADLDNLDLLTQINSMFDPDQAVGVILDQRVAINGIQRQAGTFTVTNITMVIGSSVNLYGLDQTSQPVYTVSDSAGNLWGLQTTQLGVSSGTHVYAFQAAVPGAVLTTPNTITVQVTVTLGVTSVNNPTTYSVLGINEESDANLKLRRQKSVSLASQGYLAGLYAALENINGVTFVQIYENNTNSTDMATGIPGHSIWVIIAGSASAASIANAIYQKRNAGAGMFGDVTYNVLQVDGTFFTVTWSDVIAQNLFIKFTASSINGTNQPNLAAILAGLPTAFVPGVFSEVNITALGTAVQTLDSNTLVTNAGFSVAKTQIMTLSGIAASGAFVVNYNGNTSASINWNDSISTIQTKVQAISGLATALVTGSIASQTVTFTLSSVVSVLGLIYITSNTLMTVGPAAITASFNEGYANTLLPTLQDYQFAVASGNIVILPMILSPTTVTLAPLAVQTFTGLGGYGTYTYAVVTNNSGGSINNTTGVYTVGSTPNVTDTLSATDVFGNQATATVNVS